MLGLILAVQAVLLAVAAATNRGRLNTDGVAYLRLAHDYAEGPLHLAVSGYWGPMLSWLVAPLLAFGVEPLLAGRVVMAVTALGFTAGCASLLRSLALPARTVQAGTAIAALAGLGWSIEIISPDLLVAGLVCLALALMTAECWTKQPRWALGTGTIWGTAYLAKAVALPLAVGLGLLIALVRFFRSPPGNHRHRIWRQLALTWVACGIVAAPWIVVLSIKYHTPTFSTSAKAAHAVVGPKDVDRYHPFARTFHRPEDGRITSWEDPTSLPYATWSPFASGANFRHQLNVSARNALTAVRLLGTFDLLHLGVISALLLAILGLRRLAGAPLGATSSTSPKPPGGDPKGATSGSASRLEGTRLSGDWIWPPLLLLGLSGVYLPAYLELVDQRYFYATLPLLFAAAAMAADGLKDPLVDRSPALNRLLWPLVLVSFAALPAINALSALQGGVNPAAWVARAAADGIAKTGRPGPIAGSGLLAGDRTGVFTAFFLDQPWYGDKPDATAEEFAASGARWVMVQGRRPVAAQLATDPGFTERTQDVLKELELGNPQDFLRLFERPGWSSGTFAGRSGVPEVPAAPFPVTR